MCQYTNSTSSGGPQEWLRTKDTISSAATGPEFDHTNKKDGHYIYMEGTVENSGTATGVLASGEIDFLTGMHCLSFWYNMFGENIGPFTVFTASAQSPAVNRTNLWTRNSQTDRRWHFAEVEFNITGAMKIYFEATRESSTESDTSVDDIRLWMGACKDPMYESPADCNFDTDFCGYEQLSSDSVLRWHRADDRTNTTGTGPTEDSPPGYAGSYAYIETSIPVADRSSTAALTSPALTWDPTKICLRLYLDVTGRTDAFIVESEETGTGTRTPIFSSGSISVPGWRMVEIDLDLATPLKFHFIGSRAYDDAGDGQLLADIALDDVSVENDTCRPVPWTDGWSFTCERPTTPCVNGDCSGSSQQCVCNPGFVGPQCDVPRDPMCRTMCDRGSCSGATCICPDGYYGDMCQHETLQAECDRDTMLINLFPYGFDSATWNIRPPEISSTSCPLVEVSHMPAYRAKGWQGFAREFLHDNDPCGGSVTLESETPTLKTYSRQLKVYFDPLGRHRTDAMVTVRCSIPNLPRAQLTFSMKELGRSIPPLALYVEGKFTLNIPNRDGMTEIKVMSCTASNGVQSISVVENSCAIYQVGSMLYDGPQMGTEFLILRVYKRFNAALKLRVRCSVRLCDSAHDFFCYKRELCIFRTRRKRSVPITDMEEATGKNMISVESTVTING